METNLPLWATRFIKRWTITVVYIAIVLTALLILRVYEVFVQ